MKKFLLLLIVAMTFSSCSIDDGGSNYYLEVLPVSHFEVPESFVTGRKYEMKVYYKLPTTCHFLEGFYYAKEDNIRIVGIQSKVIEGDACTPLDTEAFEELKFTFEAGNNESYIFKFYKGQDQDGNDVFEDVEIPVYPYEIPATNY